MIGLKLQVGNIIKPLPQANTYINRTKPTKMQQRGSSMQNQQNQSPNVGATSSSAIAAGVSSNEVKANLDSVLEISVDKRNVRNSSRGGKRKRINLIDGNQDSSALPSTSSVSAQ